MRITFIKLTPFLIILILITVFSINLKYNEKKSRDNLVSPLIGKKVPKIKIKLFNTNNYQNLNEYNEIYAINFFASWCIPCKIEAPIIKKLSKKIPVFGIAFKDKKSNILDFLKSYGNPYDKIGIDTNGLLGVEWGVYGIPETYIINKNGNIIYKFVGPLTLEELTKNIYRKIDNEE